MASGPSNPQYGQNDDLIDPDDATLNDLDDPLESAPLTGNIQSSSARGGGGASGPSRSGGGGGGGGGSSQSYLNSTIRGEDRRAPINTIDESVWDTLRRDLLASWKKMQLVLWPKNLLGGRLMGPASGAEAAERGEAAPSANAMGGATDGLRGLAGRIPDADALLQGAMSEELRDWDLWGPLLFSILLSLLLSIPAAANQKQEVFAGIFAIVWTGTVIVTWQIRLLGGKIAFFQTVCIIGYTLFPIVIAALLSAVRLPTIPRIPIYIVLLLWSFAAGVSILGGSGVVRNRVGLAVYPLFVFYLGLGCLCFIS